MVVQDQVLSDGERADTAVLLTVLGDEPKASINGSLGDSPVIGLPSRWTDPKTEVTPSSASASSVWPLPWTPAMQSNLPAEHLKIKILHERAVRAGS